LLLEVIRSYPVNVSTWSLPVCKAIEMHDTFGYQNSIHRKATNA
jgi:hypothetical protein